MARHRIVAVSKKKVLAKTGGKCAYCGKALTVRTMQRDHVEPLVRFKNVRYSFSGRYGCKYPENHRLDNIVACCCACNKDKGAMDLETWRASLKWFVRPVVFWMERAVVAGNGRANAPERS